jgi:ligand-binding sensor domain-containing protein
MRMKSVYFALTIALLCCFANAQWRQIGPYVGGATCFATMGPRVFAGMVGGGIFVSTDNGTSWTAVNTGLPDSNVTALAVSGTSVLAGTSSGVFLSTDNGAHWTSAISGLYVYSFGVCGAKLFAAAADSGERIFLSTDSGISWTAANMPFPRFSSMVQLDSILYAGVNDGTMGGLYLSPDNGDSWTLSSNGLAAPYVSALAVSGTAVFAGTGNGIYRSTNSGASWAVVDSGLASTNVRALAVSGSTLFAGTDSGIFHSTDNGDTWHTANSGLVSKSVFALSASGTRIFAGTSLGISVSTDNGSNWAVRKLGRNPCVGITALAARGSELFVAAAWGGGSKSLQPVENCVFHSTDNGESWTPQLAAEVDAIVIRASDVFVGSGSQ